MDAGRSSEMPRRAFMAVIAGGLLAAPLAAEAQEVGKTPRVGYLLPSPTRRSNEEFVVGLRTLGYMEGRNIFIERRYAEGRPERYRQLATELVQLHVAVMVADGSAATRAAKAATTRIPIVMIAADPVGSGFIATLNRPGQNVTGLSTNSPALIGKRLELLRQAFPQVSTLGVLFNPLVPSSESFVRESESAAQALGLRTVRAPVPGVERLDTAFEAMVSSRADAILLIEEPTVIGRALVRITELSAKRRLLTLAGLSDFAQSGVLMSYGADFPEMFRRTAFYVDKILKGANPADLPVEEPTKFELVINLKTAKTLGLTVPPSLLQRADQVIE